MQIKGRLKNASGVGKDDVFAGYTVEVRYFVVDDPAPPTYRRIEDRVVLQGIDPTFAFALPEAHRLGLDQELRIIARNRRAEVVGEHRSALAEVVRSERPVEIPIQRIDVDVARTPVPLRGRLRWKDAGTTDSFEGFIVRARFFARDGADQPMLPRQATIAMPAAGTFQSALPAAELFDATPITVVATYPDGGIAVTQNYPLSVLKEEIVLVVDAAPAVMVRPDPRAEDAQP